MMRPTLDVKLKAMLGEVAKARELTERAEFEEAKAAFLKLRAQCGKAGIKSAHVSWGLAIACDGLGDYEAALVHVREALTLDPLALPYVRSYNVIVERIREKLGDDTRAPDDPTTPPLYDLLLRAGEGDAKSHLAMARYHLHHGEATKAARLLESLATLAPSSRDAWRYLAVARRALGDDEGASRAEIEAAALEGHESLAFQVGATARG